MLHFSLNILGCTSCIKTSSIAGPSVPFPVAFSFLFLWRNQVEPPPSPIIISSGKNTSAGEVLGVGFLTAEKPATAPTCTWRSFHNMSKWQPGGCEPCYQVHGSCPGARWLSAACLFFSPWSSEALLPVVISTRAPLPVLCCGRRSQLGLESGVLTRAVLFHVFHLSALPAQWLFVHEHCPK